MKKFLAAASLLVSLSSAAHGVDEAPRVIPGSGDRNARFVIKGRKIDACRLAVEISDETRDLVDQLEPRMLYGPPENVSREKTDQWMLETQALLNSAQAHYGALEVASAACVGREVNKDRLPHVGAQSSAKHDRISGMRIPGTRARKLHKTEALYPSRTGLRRTEEAERDSGSG
jgi:hypothetical protein